MKYGLSFDCDGAIDYIENIKIEFSPVKKDGFEEIKPSDFMHKMYKVKHINILIKHELLKCYHKIPHISDINEDLPKEKRFTSMFIKCYIYYNHSHSIDPRITILTLDEAINRIVDENFSIEITSFFNNTNFLI